MPLLNDSLTGSAFRLYSHKTNLFLLIIKKKITVIATYHLLKRCLWQEVFIVQCINWWFWFILCSKPAVNEMLFFLWIFHFQENTSSSLVQSFNSCSSFVQGMLERASSVLYSATHRRAFFRSVTVVLPAHWSEPRCPRPISSGAEPTYPPAFTVSDPHPVYGHLPWTMQVGGCGRPGTTIHLTPQYIADRNFSETLGDPGEYTD